MVAPESIKPRMTVIDSQGLRIGTVESVHDAIVELSREDFSDALHHFVPLAAVKEILDDRIIVDPGSTTTVEAVITAIEYSRAHAASANRGGSLFGTSGHGTGMGGASVGN